MKKFFKALKYLLFVSILFLVLGLAYHGFAHYPANKVSEDYSSEIKECQNEDQCDEQLFEIEFTEYNVEGGLFSDIYHFIFPSASHSNSRC